MIRLLFVLGVALTVTLLSIWSDRNEAHSEDRARIAELVVLDPPAPFVAHTQRLGLVVSEPVELTGLEMKVYRVRVPAGFTVSSVKALLRERFPNLIVDETSSKYSGT